WWIGRTSRSPDLMSRKPRSARLRPLYAGTTAAAGKPSPGRRASDHIDTVEGCLRGDRFGFARPCEATFGDGEVEMLDHVATIDDGADLEGDLVRAAQRIALFLGHCAD